MCVVCTSRCSDYSDPIKIGKHGSLYQNGYKYCGVCELFIKAEDRKRCSCCMGLLRTRPRYSRQRKKMPYVRI